MKIVVNNSEEFKRASWIARSGDQIALNGGVYQELEINTDGLELVSGDGCTVFLESTLRVNGKNCSIRGLHFDGSTTISYSPAIAVKSTETAAQVHVVYNSCTGDDKCPICRNPSRSKVGPWCFVQNTYRPLCVDCWWETMPEELVSARKAYDLTDDPKKAWELYLDIEKNRKLTEGKQNGN